MLFKKPGMIKGITVSKGMAYVKQTNISVSKVLFDLAEGYRLDEIAHVYQLSESTLKTTLRGLAETLNKEVNK